MALIKLVLDITSFGWSFITCIVAVGMETSQRSPQNSVVRLPELVWPNTTIPYTFHPRLALASAVMIAITTSLKIIETNTCIRFVHLDTTEQHYILFDIDHVSGSALGYNLEEDSQVVAIPPNHPDLVKVIIQEVFRTLGREHEHQRPDRDTYISIVWQNIDKDYYERYKKLSDTCLTTQGIPYDYHSIMHYSCFHASKNSLPTILPLVSMDTNEVGMAELPSHHDYLHINLLYCAATALMVKDLSATPGTDFIQLKWTRPKVPPQAYSVRIACRVIWSGVTCRVENFQTSDRLRRSLTFKDLIPGSRCEIIFHAEYNPAGKFDALILMVDTLNAKPETFPPDLCVRSRRATSAIVLWKLPHKDMQCTNIEGYSISVENLKSGMSSIEQVANTTTTSYQLQNLTPKTNYQLKIASVNVEGTGPFSPAIEFTTKG